MTTKQIDAKYNHFIVAKLTNGVETSCTERESLPFQTGYADVKKQAISDLKARYDGHHGRGDFGVRIYGTKLVDLTTPEQFKVGFMPRLEYVRDDEILFEL